MTIRKIFIALGFAALFPFVVFQVSRTLAPPPAYESSSAHDEPGAPGETEAQAQARMARNQGRSEAAEAARTARQVYAERFYTYASAALGIVAILVGTWIALDSIGAGLLLGAVAGIAHAVLYATSDTALLPKGVAIAIGLAGLVLSALRLEHAERLGPR